MDFKSNIAGLLQTVQGHTIIVSNPTEHEFYGWIPTTIPFAKGERKDLIGFGSPNRAYDWHIHKRWDDGSIALAQVKMPFFLRPNEIDFDEIKETTNPPLAQFTFHPAIAAGSRALMSELQVSCMIGNESCVAFPLLGQIKIMRQTSSTLIFRTRSKFSVGFPARPSQLSLTGYFTIDCLPVIQATFVIGNDIRETITPAITITSPIAKFGKTSSILHSRSYGPIEPIILGDGQTMAFKHAFNMSSGEGVFESTVRARGQSEFIGFDLYENYKNTKALLTHAPVPGPRFANDKALEVKATVDSQAVIAEANAKDPIGFINPQPFQVGTQPDFAATLPLSLQKTLSSYSTKYYSQIFVATMRESFRPSFWWDTHQGIEERCSLVNDPGAVFWSGRPHFHPSYNSSITPRNVDPVAFGIWAGTDNQHQSNNHLRALYELSADPYLEDLLHYYCSVLYWAHRDGPVEAERCSRLLKESYAIGSLFRDTPEGAKLLEKWQKDCEIFDQAVGANVAKYGVPGASNYDACSPKIGVPEWCQAQQAGENIVNLCWEATFSQENQCLRDKPDLRYLEVADKYFADGRPKIRFLYPDPSKFSEGGFDYAWFAMWIMLAQKYPEAPGAKYVLEVVKPKILTEIEIPNMGYFGKNDGWKCFEI